MSPKISVSDAFDGGNIKFVGQTIADGAITVKLDIKPDVYTHLERIAHCQYFSFRVTVSNLPASAMDITYVIVNAANASYPVAWQGTTVFYSNDIESDSWKRNLSTTYVDGKLKWTHSHQENEGSIYFSYFPPFSYARHLKLISKCAYKIQTSRMNAKVETLGQTLQGREIDCISCGQGDSVCWIIHRQHPGETMAEYFAEGLLTRLLGLDKKINHDVTVQKVLNLYTFHIVPCMCLDGAVLGHLRTNSCGANLNREWATKDVYEAPTLERSPEVYAVLNRMDETGVDMFLDIHGDEELPYNFISGAEHCPTWGKRLESLHGAFVAAYTRANPDMQQNIGYPPPESEEEVLEYLNVATNQIATRFNCLAMTLEMPFKDCATKPDPEYGWSQDRSRKLGASVLEPLLYIHPYLRAEGDFWTALRPDDVYVKPTDKYEEEGFVPLKKRMYSDVRALY